MAGATTCSQIIAHTTPHLILHPVLWMPTGRGGFHCDSMHNRCCAIIGVFAEGVCTSVVNRFPSSTMQNSGRTSL